MHERQGKILRLIVEEYVRTAVPVSSRQVCELGKFDCSPATIRNEMSALEQEGLISQPHTSAGRIPTEAGYRYYIATQKAKPPPSQVLKIQIVLAKQPAVRLPNVEDLLSELGVMLAEVTGEAVMVATSRPWSRVVGISNLLRKPEFRTPEALYNLAEGIEGFDQSYQVLMKSASDEIAVLLGNEGPFGPGLASVVARCQLQKGVEGVIGIVGPLRMNYTRNIAIANKAIHIINQEISRKKTKL